MRSPAPSLRKQRTLKLTGTFLRCCSCFGRRQEDELDSYHSRSGGRASTVDPAVFGMAHVAEDEDGGKVALNKPVAWIDSPQASLVFGVAILLNCLVMAFETDWSRDTNFTNVFMTLEIIFIVIFTVEIAVRFKTHLLSFFCDSWNLFDVAVVG